MFITTGKGITRAETAAAKVSGHAEAPRVLDLSLKHAGSDVTRVSLGRTVREAEGPACCDPTTRSHTVVEKRH